MLRGQTPMTVLGKFPKSKLAIVAASLVSVAVISGALAMPQTAAVDETSTAQDTAAVAASEPQPQIIRRVYVIRRPPTASVGASPQLEPAPAAPPPTQAAPTPQPTQQATQPAPQAVTSSRGS